MKPIIMNINELSDSREVYESRPNRVFPIFLYMVVALVVIALVWMAIGKIDTVVKAPGMIRPNDNVNTVTNMYAGKLERLEVEDGSKVTKGQLLYVINHEDMLINQKYYQEQIEKLKSQIEQLTRYQQSIEDGVNYFGDSEAEKEYVAKFRSYQIQLNSLEQQYKFNQKDLSYQSQYLKEQIAYYQRELNYSKELLTCIENQKNSFSLKEESDYYNKYQMYVSDYQSLEKQYEDTAQKIDTSTQEGTLQNSKEYYTGCKSELERLKNSIDLDKDQFEKDSTYRLQYQSYQGKREQLWQEYQRALDTYDVNVELKGLAVTDWQIEESRLTAEKAKKDYDDYKSSTLLGVKQQIEEIEQKLKEVDVSETGVIDKELLLKDNEDTKKAALKQFSLKYKVELQQNIKGLNESITSLKDKLAGVERSKNSVLFYPDENEGKGYADVLKYKNDELSAVIQTIKACQDNQKEMESNLDKLNQTIDTCYVKAPIDGVVSYSVELVEGNVVGAGTEILNILPPSDTQYKALIYIDNSDIGKIKENMPIKLEIMAYPNNEYGYLFGTIEKVSNDIKVDTKSGTAYYLAEASLDADGLYDKDGKKLTMKAGMSCEVKVITGERRILSYVLDKLELIVD